MFRVRLIGLLGYGTVTIGVGVYRLSVIEHIGLWANCNGYEHYEPGLGVVRLEEMTLDS